MKRHGSVLEGSVIDDRDNSPRCSVDVENDETGANSASGERFYLQRERWTHKKRDRRRATRAEIRELIKEAGLEHVFPEVRDDG